MAQYGTTEAASRYDGVSVGRLVTYLFETQEGFPVDGTNALLRQLSPFTLRFIPPDELLAPATKGGLASSPNLIQSAARAGSNRGEANAVAEALGTSFPIGKTTQAIKAVISGGVNTNLSVNDFYPAVANVYAAADIAWQLKTMVDAPPLTLLVNPNQFSVNHTKKQSFGTMTRASSLFEAWGEEQPSISFAGSTAGFAAGAVRGTSQTKTQSISGYHSAARRDSAAWQNFMSLYLFYKNNGYIFDTVNRTNANHFIGAIAIDWDQWTYVGHFESFKFSFEEGSPHRVDFDCEFKVDRMYDWADPTYAVAPQAPVRGSEELSTTPFEMF